MSLQEIIEDLREMGEDEAAGKLIFARLGLFQGYKNCSGHLSETAPTLQAAFLWLTTPEGCGYWADLHHKLEKYRETRNVAPTNN